MIINIYSFLLPILAGLSTLIGTIFIFFKFKNNDKVILSSLAFASGVMITISLTDLIPESLELLNSYFFPFPKYIIMLIFFSIGVIISMLIDKYLPDNNNGKLYKVGIISMFAIIIHNLPEGIATFMATSSDISLGISLTLAIAFHNIPEGISISVPIFYATKSKSKAFLYTLISAISEPFGALLAYIFLRNFINNFILGSLFAVIAGIMVHISYYELLPTSFKYKNKRLSIIFFVSGVVISIINHFVFS